MASNTTFGLYMYGTTTTESPLTLKMWGLLFIFACIIVMTLLCITCMFLLVLFGCLSSFLCYRGRNQEETTTA